MIVGTALIVVVLAGRIENADQHLLCHELLPGRRQPLENGPSLFHRLRYISGAADIFLVLTDRRDQRLLTPRHGRDVRRIDVLIDERRLVHAGPDSEQDVHRRAAGLQIGIAEVDREGRGDRLVDDNAIRIGGVVDGVADRPHSGVARELGGDALRLEIEIAAGFDIERAGTGKLDRAGTLRAQHVVGDVAARDDAGDVRRREVLAVERQIKNVEIGVDLRGSIGHQRDLPGRASRAGAKAIDVDGIR